MTPDQRDCYDNWILLCGHCHDVVDHQENSYSKDDLHRWKVSHEKWVEERLATHMSQVTWAELEVVAKAVLRAPGPASQDFALTDPAEKLRRNGLSPSVHRRLTVGQMMAGDVQRFVQHVALVDPDLPEGLKAGFVVEYRRLWAEGVEGDLLFEELHAIASGGSTDFMRQAAGLAILTYLFEKCEVFKC